MKLTDKKKPINTIPKGIWESSDPTHDKDKKQTASPSTDLQGNGYPADKQGK